MTETKRLSLDRIDAVVLDMDGVLTDTARTHATAWKRLFDAFLSRRGEDFGPFENDDYLRYVDGKPRYDGVRSFLGSRGISLPEGSPDDPPTAETVCGLGNLKDRYFLEHLHSEGADAYPGSVRLVEALHRAGVRTAVISASRNAADVLAAAGIAGMFSERVDGVVAAEMGLAGKPDPAVFIEAARRLGADVSRTAIVEDALAGVEAGRRGDFALVIGVDRSGLADEMRRRGADLVVNDLGELRLDRSMRTLPPALDHLEQIKEVMTGRRPAVFLDFDGTLSPIVEEPHAAELPDHTRPVLERLAGTCTVAIISGRDLADVRERVGLEGVVYAGSHGFDIEGPGIGKGQDRGAEFLPALDAACAKLEAELGDIPGIFVERKRYAIAIHYRRVDEDAHLDRIRGGVQAAAEEHPELRASGGKKVFELRPRLDWHKGKAVLWLMETLGLGESSFPVFVGDDVTDEDAFDELQGLGLGVVVGEEDRPTAAQYSLGDTDQAREFLAALAQMAER